MSKTITRFFPSEFSKDGYNRSFIEKFIDAAMCIPDSEATERRINIFNIRQLSENVGAVGYYGTGYVG